ncbi:hypothetical protein Gogos_003353, partial [Gossypium gossypioides]|nr:hypothetical protein [Gossypium gossypioides]
NKGNATPKSSLCKTLKTASGGAKQTWSPSSHSNAILGTPYQPSKAQPILLLLFNQFIPIHRSTGSLLYSGSGMCAGMQIQNSDTSDIWNNNWFSTNQFMLEVIFHNRMKKYKCLTNGSIVASAIFVPYYAGLDLRHYLWGFNTSMRDSSGFNLINWLKQKPQWKSMSVKDHFLVSGRIARDFRRKSDRKSEWGSNFRFLPNCKNMSMLTIESGPWKNDMIVPYPTSFHHSRGDQVLLLELCDPNFKRLLASQVKQNIYSF